MKIIAECGCNYKNMEEAKEMIRECKRLNIFLCKFQIFNEDNIKDIEDPKVREFLRSIMLDYDKAKELFDYGREIGQEVFFTPMFENAVDWLFELKVPYCKIRYKDNDNETLILKIIKAHFYKVFISTQNPSQFFSNFKRLFCIPTYPAPIEKYNGIDIRFFHGISDHTNSINLLKGWYNKFKNYSFGWYIEKHVCLTKDCLEKDWSCTFKELEEALKSE